MTRQLLGLVQLDTKIEGQDFRFGTKVAEAWLLGDEKFQLLQDSRKRIFPSVS